MFNSIHFMKKLLFIFSFLFLSFVGYSQIGVRISPSISWTQVKILGLSNSSGSNFGTTIGVMYKAGVADRIAVQPSLSFGMIFVDGESASALGLGADVKYYLADDLQGFNVYVGPVLGYSLEEASEDVNKLGLGFSLGLGYDIDNIQVGLGLVWGISNAFNDMDGWEDLLSAKARSVGVSIAYLF